jgi:hypothetical protein
MPTRVCRTCASRCYIIPLSCVFEKSGMFKNASPMDDAGLLGLMERAQDTTLASLSGPDCLSAVCADILAFETSGTAIPAASQAFIDTATPVVIAKMKHLWMAEYGAGSATKDGLRMSQNLDAKLYATQLAYYASEVSEASRAFERFLEDNRADYPCLPPPPSPCEEPEDDYGMPSFYATPRGGGSYRWDGD